MKGKLHAVLGGASSVAFAPYLWRLAAERSGLAVEEMAGRASQLVASLQAAARLVEADAIHLLVGQAGDPAHEALERLVTAGSPFDVVGVITGPLLHAERGTSPNLDDCAEQTEDIARAVLEAGCDVLAVEEPRAEIHMTPCFRTLARMAGHYGARTLLIGPPAGAFALDAGFDALDAGSEGPISAGVTVGLAPGPDVAVVTSPWWPDVGGADADDLRDRSRTIAQTEGAMPCP